MIHRPARRVRGAVAVVNGILTFFKPHLCADYFASAIRQIADAAVDRAVAALAAAYACAVRAAAIAASRPSRADAAGSATSAAEGEWYAE